MEKTNNNIKLGSIMQAEPVVLDLTGLQCPLPVLKARRQIGQMLAGAVLVVMADDPASPLDFDHFCQNGGHQLLESTEKNGVYTMRISKVAK
ncbi:sulfurtransferase TusA family protein [Candidatus Puniceispirillum sp.]|nr:sulfurtransferase TusA family protein [Candidatus Puniceispirillum sp.]